MRKFFLLLSIVGLSLSLLLTILVINIRFVAFNPNIVKSLLEKSNIYSLISGNLRDEVVSKYNMQINDGQILEDVSENISDTAVKNIVEDGINQFSQIASQKSVKKEIILDYRPLIAAIEQKSGLTLPAEKSINAEIVLNISNPIIYRLITNFDLAIIFASICSIIFLLIMLLLADSVVSRLNSIMAALLVATIVTILTVAAFYLASHNFSNQLISLIKVDPNIQNGIKKLLIVTLNQFSIYLYYEAGILLVIQAVLFYFKKSVLKPKIEFINF